MQDIIIPGSKHNHLLEPLRPTVENKCTNPGLLHSHLQVKTEVTADVCLEIRVSSYLRSRRLENSILIESGRHPALLDHPSHGGKRRIGMSMVGTVELICGGLLALPGTCLD